MSQLILDKGLVEKLHELKQITELCDASGNVLGEFVPRMVRSGDWEPVTPDLTKEELDRLANSTEWYTPAQVLDHLNKLR